MSGMLEYDFIRTALLATPTITTEAYYNNGWKAFGSAGGTLVGGSIEELPSSDPSRIEQTNSTGRGSRPSASARLLAFWRRARSSAADSKAQRR